MTTRTKNQEAIQILTLETDKTSQWLRLDAQASLQAVREAFPGPDMFRRGLDDTLKRQADVVTVEQIVRSPDVAPQWIAVLLALGARVSFVEEAQEVALADFLRCVGLYPGRIAAVHTPMNVPGSVSGEAYLMSRGTDAPVVAALAVVVLTEGFVRQARLAVMGVWREPARLADSADLLVGGPLIIRRIRRVAEAVEQEVASHDDIPGNAGYRWAMAGVLTYCALEQCRTKSQHSTHE
jgi:xanthine dehydrogenase iron-sulfur cluster and FAD-binding subunit A